MSAINPVDQQILDQQKAVTDKEFNFAQLRKQLEQEKAEKQHYLQRIQEVERRLSETNKPVEESEDDDPYVDKKNLQRKFAAFEKDIEQKIERKSEEKARHLMEEEKKNQWLRNNSDFFNVMEHAQKFADKDPELAESILAMPDTFERQKLVYKNIKLLGLHEKEREKSSIQEKIDQNRKGLYYQPSGTGTPAYAPHGDFTPTGKKSAYDVMKSLQARLGIS